MNVIRKIVKRCHFFCGLGGGAKGLAWSGKTFFLDAQPIWVQPIAIAISMAGRVVV
jgi:hypothetical protein